MISNSHFSAVWCCSLHAAHASSSDLSRLLAPTCEMSNAHGVTTQTLNVTQIIQGFLVSLTMWVPNDVFTISNAPTLESGSKQ
jgi:hypothetical protein